MNKISKDTTQDIHKEKRNYVDCIGYYTYCNADISRNFN